MARERRRDPPLMLLLAHRGDWRVAPENSVAALVAGAHAPRSDGVEFDVHLSADGIPVVIHDEDLLRVQGEPQVVARMTGDVLAAHGVPSLAEVLAVLPDAAFLDVELKVVPNHALAEVLIRARGPAPARAIISSFDPRALRDAAALLPDWPRWLNVERVDDLYGAIATARAAGCVAISAEWPLITPRSARAVHVSGLRLAAWTVRRRATVGRLARLGVVAACVEGSPLDL
jgi:glycerophosphoryl diester phosphodiesterase